MRGRRWGLESKSAKPGAKRRPGSIHGRLLHRALVRLATEIVMAVWRVGLRYLRRSKKPAQRTVAIIQGGAERAWTSWRAGVAMWISIQ